MKIVSDVLYHFVGFGRPDDDEKNFETLVKIVTSMKLLPSAVDGLRDGMRSKYDPDHPRTKGEAFMLTVCCFCDIPLESLSHVHCKKYGRFGVGLDRRILASQGAQPVTYIPKVKWPGGTWADRHVNHALWAWYSLREHYTLSLPSPRTVPNPPILSAQDAADFACQFLRTSVIPFLKEFDAELPDEHVENYYMEREWRKWGSTSLHDKLRAIVVPEQYLERARDAMPDAASKVLPLP